MRSLSPGTAVLPWPGRVRCRTALRRYRPYRGQRRAVCEIPHHPVVSDPRAPNAHRPGPPSRRFRPAGTKRTQVPPTAASFQAHGRQTPRVSHNVDRRRPRTRGQRTGPAEGQVCEIRRGGGRLRSSAVPALRCVGSTPVESPRPLARPLRSARSVPDAAARAPRQPVAPNRSPARRAAPTASRRVRHRDPGRLRGVR